MHGVMNPMRNVVIEPGAPTLKPLWSEGTKARSKIVVVVVVVVIVVVLMLLLS